MNVSSRAGHSHPPGLRRPKQSGCNDDGLQTCVGLRSAERHRSKDRGQKLPLQCQAWKNVQFALNNKTNVFDMYSQHVPYMSDISARDMAPVTPGNPGPISATLAEPLAASETNQGLALALMAHAAPRSQRAGKVDGWGLGLGVVPDIKLERLRP